MIGPKKLSTIREEIRKALASSGEDPIQWLERNIASAKRMGNRTEILEGLQRFLEAPPKQKRRKQRYGLKK
jgi:hypothetical protein